VKPVVTKNRRGDKFWRRGDRDTLHREDGPAIEYVSGEKQWWINDLRHRADGPAVEFVDGSKIWYLHGKCHREDGPAMEEANGHNYWYLDNTHMTFDDWLEETTGLTDEGKLMFKLEHG
jgi:hypothetical protein